MKHSLSPVIHNAAYTALNLPYHFSVTEVHDADLPSFFKLRATDLAGLAVTSPYKHAVIPYLDAVEPMANTLGVVNTIVFTAQLATGFNTDVYGIRQALLEAPQLGEKLVANQTISAPEPLHSVIVGGGATAISALMASAEMGVKSISIIARSFHKPPSIVKVAASLGLTPRLIPWKQPGLVEKTLQAADLVISTVPSENFAEIAGFLHANPRLPVVLEAAYKNPQPPVLETVGRVGTYVAGTRMLLHQATQQFALHTGQVAPLEVMEAALEAHLRERN